MFSTVMNKSKLIFNSTIMNFLRIRSHSNCALSAIGFEYAREGVVLGGFQNLYQFDTPMCMDYFGDLFLTDWNTGLEEWHLFNYL